MTWNPALPWSRIVLEEALQKDIKQFICSCWPIFLNNYSNFENFVKKVCSFQSIDKYHKITILVHTASSERKLWYNSLIFVI